MIKNWKVFALLCAVAVLLRLLVTFVIYSTGEYSYDLNSWNQVATLVLDGKNVYANTTLYNYGPLWFYVIAGLKSITGDIRYSLALLLSIVDVLIALILFKRRNYMSSLLFLFSPISIVTSGFYSQFDNLAILIGLCGIAYVESRASFRNQQIEDLSFLESIAFSSIIGLSLMTKHIFFAFPIWMFFKSRRLKQKLIFLALPPAIFLLSFLPYLPEGLEGIKNNVFNYRAHNNAPFYNLFAPQMVNMVGYKLHLNVEQEAPRILFFLLIVLSGIFFRRKNIFECLVFYLACMFIFSSSILEEYMAIPVLFTAAFPNFYTISFNVFGGVYYYLFFFVNSSASLMGTCRNFFVGSEGFYRYVVVVLLLLGLLQALFKKQIGELLTLIFHEFAEALGLTFLIPKIPK